MKKNITLFCIFLFISLLASSQVTLKLGTIENAQPGTYVNIPLIVSGLSSTGQSFIGVEAVFTYQENIISYDSLTNGHPMTPVNQWFAGTQNGKLAANWLEPALQAVNVEDNSTLIELVFFYSGGQTDLIFDEAVTGVYDINGSLILVSQFINGSISQSQGSGISTWNGTADWSQLLNWDNGIPGDSTDAIINSGIVTIVSGAVCRNLTVSQGSKMIIQPGYSLTVNGDLINSGEIIIESDSLKQGSLITKGNMNQTGTSVMKFKTYNGIMYQFAPPVEGAEASLFTNVGSVTLFNENSNSFSSLPPTSDLEPGRGYALDASGNSTISFNGLFKPLSLAKNLSFTSAEFLSEGWNLVGNPFSSAFDTDDHLNSQNLDRSIYVWDGFVYRVWNGTAGSIPNGIIPPMAAFFVKANNSAASLTFTKEGKIHDFTRFSGTYTPPVNVLPIYLRSFNNSSIEDRAYIQIEETSSFNYDGEFDALKLSNSSGYPEVFLHSWEDYHLAIAAIPAATDIEAGIRIPVDGTYVIGASTSIFLPERPVFLIDQELEIIKDLRIEDYTFIIEAGNHPKRFKVVLSGIGVDEVDKPDSFRVISKQGNIRITSFVEHGLCAVKVFDISGRQVLGRVEVMNQGSSVEIPGIRGVNIITIENQTSKFRYKVVVL